MVRRDMESMFQRFWKCENTSIKLIPIDESDPRQGGRVEARISGLDVRTLMPYSKLMHGVYGEDFITFGQFAASESHENEETLLKLFEEKDEAILDKHTFKFENNQVTYKREVNPEHHDADIEHAISETVLAPTVDQSWSETLFYGVGNKNM
jgi:hypothetical protein